MERPEADLVSGAKFRVILWTMGLIAVGVAAVLLKIDPGPGEFWSPQGNPVRGFLIAVLIAGVGSIVAGSVPISVLDRFVRSRNGD